MISTSDIKQVTDIKVQERVLEWTWTVDESDVSNDLHTFLEHIDRAVDDAGGNPQIIQVEATRNGTSFKMVGRSVVRIEGGSVDVNS